MNCLPTDSARELAWFFDFGNGFPAFDAKDGNGGTWAVRSGEVAVVPLPAGVWLLGSGLLELVGLRRGGLRR